MCLITEHAKALQRLGIVEAELIHRRLVNLKKRANEHLTIQMVVEQVGGAPLDFYYQRRLP